MTTPTDLSDQAIAQAFRDCQVFAAPLRSNEFIRNVEDRAREIQAQQGQQGGGVDWVAKLIADHVGHGMREKCEAVAEQIVSCISNAGGVVDDAMVERATSGYEQEWKRRDDRGDESIPISALVRAALCAALGVENE